MTAPEAPVAVAPPTPQERTLRRVHELLAVDITHHSPNRPTEFRMSRHPRGGNPSLAKLFYDLGFTRGAEIGVEQGRFSAELLSANPDLHLFSVDPWLAYSRYKDTVEQEKCDGYYAEALRRLEPYSGRSTVMRATSVEAVTAFEDESLDFVFIDGNHHFDYVVVDIIEWSRKVRPGGIVAGHDFKNEAKNGRIPFHVVQASSAYVDAYHIKPWFVIRGDKAASFFWVRP